MKFNNLTPHTINILNEEKQLIKTIEPNGLARCQVSKEQVSSYDNIPFYQTTFGEVEGLPVKEDNVINIVSLVVRQACPTRADLYSPGELVRDDSGQPIGCIGLSR
jgi:hypothetical protein